MSLEEKVVKIQALLQAGGDVLGDDNLTIPFDQAQRSVYVPSFKFLNFFYNYPYSVKLLMFPVPLFNRILTWLSNKIWSYTLKLGL